MLDKKFVEKQKSILLSEKDSLGEEIKKLDKYEDLGYSEEDNATELEHYQEKQAIRVKLQTELEAVEEALKRVSAGTYGICQNCHKPISRGRLQAAPWVKYCLNCR